MNMIKSFATWKPSPHPLRMKCKEALLLSLSWIAEGQHDTRSRWKAATSSLEVPGKLPAWCLCSPSGSLAPSQHSGRHMSIVVELQIF